MNSGNEKSKLLATHTPKPNMSSKHIKKQHLLSASVNTTPNAPLPVQGGKQGKTGTKKSKSNTASSHFQDSSNLPSAQVGQMPQNPAAAAAAAAAAALQYHHYLNNNLAAKTLTNSTPQKPNPKFHLANGGYADDENNRNVRYEDADEEEFEPKGEHYEDEEMKEPGSVGNNLGSLSVKNLTQSGPLTQSNMNNPNGNGPPSNLEFECTACEKKFKYYCYYKRHMDACHSEWPKYVCDTCNKSYKWEASFRQHLRSHHGQTGMPGLPEHPGENGDMKNENNGYNSDEDNNENMMDENRRMMNESGLNESGNDGENGRHGEDDDDEEEEEHDIDSQEQDIEQQINQSQNEPRNNYYERDNEQIGAAGTLASIAESLNGRLMINNHNYS